MCYFQLEEVLCCLLKHRLNSTTSGILGSCRSGWICLYHWMGRWGFPCFILSLHVVFSIRLVLQEIWSKKNFNNLLIESSRKYCLCLLRDNFPEHHITHIEIWPFRLWKWNAWILPRCSKVFCWVFWQMLNIFFSNFLKLCQYAWE